MTWRQRASQPWFDLIKLRERAGIVMLRAIDSCQAKQGLVDDDLIPGAPCALEGSLGVVLRLRKTAEVEELLRVVGHEHRRERGIGRIRPMDLHGLAQKPFGLERSAHLRKGDAPVIEPGSGRRRVIASLRDESRPQLLEGRHRFSIPAGLAIRLREFCFGTQFRQVVIEGTWVKARIPDCARSIASGASP